MNRWLKWVVSATTILAGMGTMLFVTPLLSTSYKTPGSAAIAEGESQDAAHVSVLIQTTREQVSELTHGSRVALQSYDNLINIILKSDQKEKALSSTDMQTICSSILFAARQSQGKTRKNPQKTPYLCYLLDMTSDLVKAEGVKNPSLIVGSILHDTVSGKGAVLREIHKQFGSEVASLVQEVSAYPVSAKAANQRALLVHAPKQSSGATQIDLADLLYSLKELSTSPPAHWKKDQVDHYFEWAQSVLDRFPDQNSSLYVAAENTIQTYWSHQG